MGLQLTHATCPPAASVQELGDQIYVFRLFTEESAVAFTEAVQAHPGWRSRPSERPTHPYRPGLEARYEPDDLLHDEILDAAAVPGLQQTWDDAVDLVLGPLIETLWPVFSIQLAESPYLARYHPDRVQQLAPHFDLETVSLVTYLNRGFEGGGTVFPRWKVNTRGLAPGMAILFPGGLSHVHRADPVVDGIRYVLNGAFF